MALQDQLHGTNYSSTSQKWLSWLEVNGPLGPDQLTESLSWMHVEWWQHPKIWVPPGLGVPLNDGWAANYGLSWNDDRQFWCGGGYETLLHSSLWRNDTSSGGSYLGLSELVNLIGDEWPFSNTFIYPLLEAQCNQSAYLDPNSRTASAMKYIMSQQRCIDEDGDGVDDACWLQCPDCWVHNSTLEHTDNYNKWAVSYVSLAELLPYNQTLREFMYTIPLDATTKDRAEVRVVGGNCSNGWSITRASYDLIEAQNTLTVTVKAVFGCASDDPLHLRVTMLPNAYSTTVHCTVPASLTVLDQHSLDVEVLPGVIAKYSSLTCVLSQAW